MLNSECFTIISLDPSVDNLGFSVLQINLENKKVFVEWSETFSGKKLMRSLPQVIEVHGERAAKLESGRLNLLEQFDKWKPDVVVAESPFLGRFPQAFGALMECLMMIRTAVITYDETVSLYKVDPPTVKMTVGVSGRSSDKEEMRQAIRKLDDVTFSKDIEVEALDEHSCDSIAVGYWCYKFLFGD